jgi:hypothetical protein
MRLQTHFCLLDSSLFLFFSATFHILIVLPSLNECCEECIKYSIEIIWLNCWVILTEQSYSSIKLKELIDKTVLQLHQKESVQWNIQFYISIKVKQVNGWHSASASSNQNSSIDPTALQVHQIEIVEWMEWICSSIKLKQFIRSHFSPK